MSPIGSPVCYRCDFGHDDECTCGRQQVHTQRLAFATMNYARDVLRRLDDVEALGKRALLQPLTDEGRTVVTSSLAIVVSTRDQIRAMLANTDTLRTDQIMDMMDSVMRLRNNGIRILEIAGVKP